MKRNLKVMFAVIMLACITSVFVFADVEPNGSPGRAELLEFDKNIQAI